MKDNISSSFMQRQYMELNDYEIYYFHDIHLKNVDKHTHDYYELYLFLEGSLDYVINQKNYKLKKGDFFIIPPNTLHQPIILNARLPYRRFVLWVKKDYLLSIIHQDNHLFELFNDIKKNKNYHIDLSNHLYQDIQARFVKIIEERKMMRPFYQLESTAMLSSLLVKLYRIYFEKQNAIINNPKKELYLSLCDYINSHLNDNLSLETLASKFFASKFYISHVFKEQMGISIHQYILQKRLESCKDSILSGENISKCYLDNGFENYSTFYRAFKKAYGISPKEFQKQYDIF